MARIMVAGAPNAQYALESILKIVSEIMPCHDVQIRIRDSGKLRLLKRWKKVRDQTLQIVSEEDADTLSGYVVRSGNPLYINDFALYQKRIKEGEHLPRGKNYPPGPSLAILPLQIEWARLGILRVEPAAQVEWDEPGLKSVLIELAAMAARLVHTITINQNLAEGKAAAEREVALAFGAIHGVKGPAQAVRNYLELVITLQGKGKLTPEKANEYAMSARQALTRVERLAERLLRLSRPRKGLVRTQDTESLFKACIEENRSYHPNLVIEYNVASDATVINVESEEFSAVLDELITNSSRAMKKGGRVIISAHSDGDSIRIIIEDNGPGVSPEDLDHIFDRWFTNFPGGSGLGLSFVRKVVEDLKGTVIAELSNPGLRFVIRIPKDISS